MLHGSKSNAPELFSIKDERWARYQMASVYPALPMIRNTEGKVHWMEVRGWLKQQRQSCKRPVKQFIFKCLHFDVISVRRGLKGILAEPRSSLTKIAEQSFIIDGLSSNQGDRIRTCDLVDPNHTLYQAELHPVLIHLVLQPTPILAPPRTPCTAGSTPRIKGPLLFTRHQSSSTERRIDNRPESAFRTVFPVRNTLSPKTDNPPTGESGGLVGVGRGRLARGRPLQCGSRELPHCTSGVARDRAH